MTTDRPAVPSQGSGDPTVYLLHFERRYWHAGHYLGWASDLPARLDAHRAGRGARLVEVVLAAGIGFSLVRTWPGGRDLERHLKRRKEGPRLCPVCRAERGLPPVGAPAPAVVAGGPPGSTPSPGGPS